MIHLFDNPLRKRVQNPGKILAGLVLPGHQCLDVGCGYGYFTLPMAHRVGPTGSVTALDLQPEMLEGVRRRAEKEGLQRRIRLHQADPSGLHLAGAYDFALAFWMMHEVADQAALLAEVSQLLTLGGHLLLVEPKVHVSAAAFGRTVTMAEECGFSQGLAPKIFFSRAVVLEKTRPPAA
jgi:ubiquinone/menaquinone biosynthesis C-methylase UbiE